MALGYSFSPTQAQADQAKAGQVSPPFGAQGAIKTLNFSLPKITGAAGASALSPQVGEQRRGPGISSAVLESVLRTVLGPDHASMVLAPQPMAQGMGNERAPNGPQDYGGGGGDTGMAAIMAALSGGQPSSPGVTIHPGDLGPDAPQAVPSDREGSREVITQPDFDRTGQQGPPRTPDFGGGGNWRTNKYDEGY